MQVTTSGIIRVLVVTVVLLGLYGCSGRESKGRSDAADATRATASSAPTTAATAPAPSKLAAEAAPTPISPKDAEGLTLTLGAATSQSDPKDRAEMLRAGCSEIPTCAGSCAKALVTASSPASSSKEKDAALEGCFADFERDHTSSGLTREDWIERYVARYADRWLSSHVLAGKNEELLKGLLTQLRAK